MTTPPKIRRLRTRSAQMKILYVENHEVFAANVTRQFLSQQAVTVAPSIAAARQARVAGTFDLLLVDYDLDDGKGDAFVREVRALGDRILIVGISSHDEGNAALHRAGASAICSKMQFDRIQSVIERLKWCAMGGHWRIMRGWKRGKPSREKRSAACGVENLSHQNAGARANGCRANNHPLGREKMEQLRCLSWASHRSQLFVTLPSLRFWRYSVCRRSESCIYFMA
jgi:CheY-like chemotaxis protein